MKEVQVLLVGTGGHVWPRLYCPEDCPLCLSRDPRDNRVETSVLVTARDGDNADRVLVDAGRGSAGRMGEFLWGHREIEPKSQIAVGCNGQVDPRIDFLALTHGHFDHWGDIENFSKMHGRDWRSPEGVRTTETFTVYTHPKTRERLEAATEAIGKWGNWPAIRYVDCDPKRPHQYGQITLQALVVQHGDYDGCLAFLVEAQGKRVVIAPDLDPLEEWENQGAAKEFRAALAGAHLLVVGIAWWQTEDKRRLDAAKALDLIARAKRLPGANHPAKARLVHITHLTERTHATMSRALPALCKSAGLWGHLEVKVGYDGEAIAL